MSNAERGGPLRYIATMTVGGVCAAFLDFAVAMAMPVDMTADRLLDICEAPTVQAAMVKGDELGWPRLTDAETQEWRRSFVGYNGGSVEVVGWRGERSSKVELLSFWIATGLNGHRAAHIPRKGLPAFWMPCRSGLAHRIVSTRMTRQKVRRPGGSGVRSSILLFRLALPPPSISVQVDKIMKHALDEFGTS